MSTQKNPAASGPKKSKYTPSSAENTSFENGAGEQHPGHDSPPPEESTISLSNPEADHDDSSTPSDRD